MAGAQGGEDRPGGVAAGGVPPVAGGVDRGVDVFVASPAHQHQVAVPLGAGDVRVGEVMDVGAGRSGANETLCGRVISALKSQALLNESVGAGYIERNWPPALKGAGAWPLASLRQSFLNGSLTRLLDPDTTLRSKIVEFVDKGDFGLASGSRSDGGYDRVWFGEFVGSDEVSFDSGVFLLLKAKAKSLKSTLESKPKPDVGDTDEVVPEPETIPEPKPQPEAKTRTLRISGDVPPEVWNRLGTKILPKLRSGSDLKVGISFSVTFDSDLAGNMETDLRQILEDLELTGKVRID